jgi:hypothetical protein
MGNTCNAGTSNGACGEDGAVCIACPTGTRCHAGSCICDPVSCPNGCCDYMNNICYTSNDQHCGTGGVACVSCPGGTTCCGDVCKGVNGATCIAGAQCCSGSCCFGVFGGTGVCCEP